MQDLSRGSHSEHSLLHSLLFALSHFHLHSTISLLLNIVCWNFFSEKLFKQSQTRISKKSYLVKKNHNFSLPPTLHYFFPPKHFAEMFLRQTFSTNNNLVFERTLVKKSSPVSLPPTLHYFSPPKHFADIFSK